MTAKTDAHGGHRATWPAGRWATAPYTAVPFPENGPLLASSSLGIERIRPADLRTHDRMVPGRLHGWIEVTAQALTPLFLATDSDSSTSAYTLNSNGKRRFAIPDTTMSGMIRNTMRTMCGGRLPEIDDPILFIRHPLVRTKTRKGTNEINEHVHKVTEQLVKEYADQGGIALPAKANKHHAGLLHKRDDGTLVVTETGLPHKFLLAKALKSIGEDLSTPGHNVNLAPLPKVKKTSKRFDNSDRTGAANFRPSVDDGTRLDHRTGERRVQENYDGTRKLQCVRIKYVTSDEQVTGIALSSTPEADALANSRATGGKASNTPDPPPTETTKEGYLYLTGIAGANRKYCYIFPKPTGEHEYPVPNEVVAWHDSPEQRTRFQRENFTSKNPDRSGTLATTLKSPEDVQPVWFTLDAHGTIRTIGRANGFRVPAFQPDSGELRTVTDGIPEAVLHHKQKKTDNSWTPDAVQAIFGDIDLPGGWGKITRRVRFSPLVAEAGTTQGKQKIISLLEPHPSAFLHYLDQGADGQVVSWSTQGAPRVRGYKQYLHSDSEELVRESLKNTSEEPAGNENTQRKIHPLPAGATFRGRITFTNLTKIELGLLLAALDLGNGAGGQGHTSRDGVPISAHKIGLGRPLGYGSIHLTYTLRLVDPRKRWKGLPEPAQVLAVEAKDIAPLTQTAYALLKDNHENCLAGVLKATQWADKLPAGKVLTMKLEGTPSTPGFDQHAPLPPLSKLWPEWTLSQALPGVFD